MNIRIITFYILIFSLIFPLAGWSNDRTAIVPIPVSIQINKGEFHFTGNTRLVVSQDLTEHSEFFKLFSEDIESITSLKLDVHDSKKGSSNIVFAIDANLTTKLGKEGYSLEINKKEVIVKAATTTGWFYASRTLLQLLHQDYTKKATLWAFPCVSIKDYPRFGWRGLMLDLSRHFFTKDVIKRYIDQMAKYKLNILHLHLTDNQGWRIEIKSLPKLTEVGAWRVPRTGYWKGFKAPQPGEEATYGGYYTQDDIRELVKYAQDRAVTIVPEVDVPGHSLALIASYPELSCTKTPQQVLAGDPWNPKRTNVLCVAADSTYLVLDKIITELAELFPSEYIHIGGDEVTRNYWKECPHCQQLIKDEKLKSEEELQTYFLKRVVKMVESKGKKAMGWYENLEGGLAPGIALMSWKDYKGGIRGSQEGHKVVMTPAFFTYLDFYQGDPAMENGPFTVTRLKSSYAFEPIQEGVVEANVLGGQGSLWTEQVPNERKMQYMTWPRSMALAEVLWSPKESKNWEDFISRMEAQFKFFDRDKVKYADVFYEPILKAEKENDKTYIAIDTEVSNLKVYYSFDDCSPDEFYPEYKGTRVEIPEGAHHIRARSYRDGKPLGRELNIAIEELVKRIPKK